MALKLSNQLKWMLSILDGYKIRLLFFLVLEVLSIFFSLGFIFFSKRAIDVALKVTVGDLNLNLVFVILCALLGILSKSLSQWVNQRTQVNLTLDFQFNILKKQMLSSWRVIKKWDTGDLLVRINSDCAEIVQMISNTWLSFIITCLKIILSFVFLFTLDKMLAIVILFITPLFLLAKVYFKKMKTLNARVKKAESEVGISMQENLRFRVLLRALGVLNSRLRFFKDMQVKFANLRLGYLNFTIFSQSMMRSALTIGYLIAFVWGIYKLQSNEISYGTMTAFLQLVNQIQSPILTLGAFFPAFVRFKVSVDRINELNNINIEPLLEDTTFTNIDSIQFDNLSFKYEDDQILNKINFTFNKGEMTSIVGASGKGKTTLIRLLLGLLKPDEGKILLYSEGLPFEINTSHIENFSYVPQGNSLLVGTIRSNITLGMHDVTEEKIREVLVASCAEFVYELPEGLDTVIGESGIGLSEGQAQRIAIARAILRNRKVWLFDEATSALDQNTTKLFLNRIKYLIKDKIVIFVTHDSTVNLECQKELLIN